MKQRLATVTALLILASGTLIAQTRETVRLPLPLKLSGGVISIGVPGNPTGTARIELNITRLSTPDERAALLAALSDEGQESLLDKLQDSKSVGTIRFNTGLGWDLRYASVSAGEPGHTRLFLATDRPVSAWEAWNQPRYADYPFTLIDIDLDQEGHSRGTLVLAARVTASGDGRFVNVENYAAAPIPIENLEVEH